MGVKKNNMGCWRIGEGGCRVVICQINETVIGGATHTIKSYNGFTGLLDKEVPLSAFLKCIEGRCTSLYDSKNISRMTIDWGYFVSWATFTWCLFQHFDIVQCTKSNNLILRLHFNLTSCMVVFVY